MTKNKIELRFGTNAPQIDTILKELPTKPNVKLYTGFGISLADAGLLNCRFPRDDKGKDGMPKCCGKRIIKSSSWCEEHYPIVTMKARPLNRFIPRD